MTNGIVGIQLERPAAIATIGGALRSADKTVIACPPATVGSAGQLLGQMANLNDWAAIIEGPGGWGALVNTTTAIQAAADEGDLCVTLLLTRDNADRFAAACGYPDSPGRSWMIFGQVSDPDAAVERPEIPPLFYAALELEDPASAAWLLGDGEMP